MRPGLHAVVSHGISTRRDYGQFIPVPEGVDTFPGDAGEPGEPGEPGELAASGVTCATVTAWLPAGQEEHGTLTIVDDAGAVTADAAVTVMAFASDAADLATLAPDTLAMLAMDDAAVAGTVMTSLETGHVGQCTATVVMEGGGGAGAVWQLTQTGGW